MARLSIWTSRDKAQLSILVMAGNSDCRGERADTLCENGYAKAVSGISPARPV